MRGESKSKSVPGIKHHHTSPSDASMPTKASNKQEWEQSHSMKTDYEHVLESLDYTEMQMQTYAS